MNFNNINVIFEIELSYEYSINAIVSKLLNK